MKVIALTDQNDVKETLTEALERADNNEFVIILELRKDGSQGYYSSKGTQYQKAFMKYFFDSAFLSWFHDE